MASDKDEPHAIKVARLKALAPELVFEELRQHAEQIQDDRLARSRGHNNELEALLQARNHPLIDIALARYGTNREVAANLYAKALAETGDAEHDKGVRIAFLANRVLPDPYFGNAPPLPADELRRLSEEGDDDEVKVMLQNPSSGGLLRDLYQQKPPFDNLPRDRFHALVHASIPNARVNIDESNENGPDILHWDIQKGIWHLIATAPVEAGWMWTLDYLLFQLDPSYLHAPDSGVKEVLGRWVALVVKDTLGNQDEDEEGFHSNADLTAVEEFRCLIAALYGKYFDGGKFHIVGSKDDQDVAFRCAYYGNASMKPEEMQACKDRDGNAFVYAALCNDSLFLDRKCRALIEEMISGQLLYRYASRCEQIAKRLKYFDPKPISESGAAVLDDIIEEHAPSGEVQALSRLESKVAELATKLDSMKSTAGWLMIGVVALLIWKQ